MTYEEAQDFILELKNNRIKEVQYKTVQLMQELNNDINDELAKIYRKYDLPKMLPDGTVDKTATLAFMQEKVKISDQGRISRLSALQLEIKKLIDPALLKRDKYIELMAKVGYQESYYVNAWAITQEMARRGYVLEFPILEMNNINSVIYNNPFSAFNLSDSTLSRVNSMMWDRRLITNRILSEIEKGMARGSSYVDMAKRLDVILGFRDPSTGKLLEKMTSKRGATYNSLRIIDTEMGRVYAQGRQDEYEEAIDQGVDCRLQWIATLDDHTRNQSAEMDGQIANENGEFTYPDGTVAQQYNSGIAEFDINDRCTTIEIINGVEPELRRSREDGIIPAQTFSEWAYSKGIEKSIYGEKYWPDE